MLYQRTDMRGFTLIEMLVVIFVVAIISIVIGDSVLSFFKAAEFATGRAGSVSAAQGALDTIVQSVRGSTYGADGSYPIASISPYSLTVFADSGPNSATERITFFVSGTSLFKSVIDPTGNPPWYSIAASTTADIADGIENAAIGPALFTYYDAAGNEITDFSHVSDVASVFVNLLSQSSTSTPVYTLQSYVTLRNLENN